MRFCDCCLISVALLQGCLSSDYCIFDPHLDLVSATSLAQRGTTNKAVKLDPEIFLAKDEIPQLTKYPSFYAIFLQIFCLLLLLIIVLFAGHVVAKEAQETYTGEEAPLDTCSARLAQDGKIRLSTHVPLFTEGTHPIGMENPFKIPGTSSLLSADRAERSFHSGRPGLVVPPLDLPQPRYAPRVHIEQAQSVDLETQSSLNSESPLKSPKSFQELVPVPSEIARSSPSRGLVPVPSDIARSPSGSQVLVNPPVDEIWEPMNSQGSLPRTRSLSPYKTERFDEFVDEFADGNTPNFGPLPPFLVPEKPLKKRPYLRPSATAAKVSLQAQWYNLATPRPGFQPKPLPSNTGLIGSRQN